LGLHRFPPSARELRWQGLLQAMAPGAKQRKRVREKKAEAEAEARAAAEASGEQPFEDPDEQDIPPMPPPEKKQKGQQGWKAVQLEMDVHKEFEAEGGLFFEEADDDFSVTYGDGRKEVVRADAKAKMKKKTKGKGGKDEEVEMEVEEPSPAGEDEALGEAEDEDGAKKGEVADEAPDMIAWTPFDLHPKLMQGLARLGFKTPTEVQSRCLTPAIRQRKDIVGAAETGSGKTLAFGLPMLHHTLLEIDKEGEGATTQEGKGASQALHDRQGGPRGLIILPTRELAQQVARHMNAVAGHTPVKAECVVGGISILKQQRLLKRKPYIVVGTPGRLHALLGLASNSAEEKCQWFSEGVADLRHLVLDEADRLVESGHFKELDGILAHVYNAVPRAQQLQTCVFSATLTLDPRSTWRKFKHGDDEGGKVGALMRRLRFREQRAVLTVDLTQPEDATAAASSSAAAGDEGEVRAPKAGRTSRLPERLELMEAVCSDDKDKEGVLAMYLLRRYRWSMPTGPASARISSTEKEEAESALAGAAGGRVVLFVNAISGVLRLSSVLSLLLESPSASKVLSRVKMANSKQDSPGISVDVLGLHSRMRQKDRMKRMERFGSLKHAVLVCTDIAARGLDVPEVAAVLHFQPPRNAETFVHRSGRTARAGLGGESVAYLGPSDASMWSKVYRATGIPKEKVGRVDITAEELNAAKEAVRLAVELEQKVHTAHKKSGDKTWMKRVAEEADLAYSEDEGDADKGDAPAARRQLWSLYLQLQNRVRRPPRRSGGQRPSKAGGGGKRPKKRRQ